MFSPKSYSTSDFGAAMILPNHYSPVSNITTTNQVGNDVNNDANSQYFATSRKNSATEIRDKNTTPI